MQPARRRAIALSDRVTKGLIASKGLPPGAASPAPSAADIFKGLATAAAGLVAVSGVTYLFGFIIVNEHASAYGLRSYELSQPTYFLAGAGYIALVLIPALTFFVVPGFVTALSRHIENEHNRASKEFKERRDDRAKRQEARARAEANLPRWPASVIFRRTAPVRARFNAAPVRTVLEGLGWITLVPMHVLLGLLGLLLSPVAYYANEAPGRYVLMVLAVAALTFAVITSTNHAIGLDPFVIHPGKWQHAQVAHFWMLLVPALLALFLGFTLRALDFYRQIEGWLQVTALMIFFVVVVPFGIVTSTAWARHVYPEINHPFGGADAQASTVRLHFSASEDAQALLAALRASFGGAFAHADPRVTNGGGEAPSSSAPGFTAQLDLYEENAEALIVIVCDGIDPVAIRVPRTAIEGAIFRKRQSDAKAPPCLPS